MGFLVELNSDMDDFLMLGFGDGDLTVGSRDTESCSQLHEEGLLE